MANSTIPVILRVMAERDPGLADTLQQIERALAELSQRAQQTMASTGGMDQGFADAAEQVRRITSAADGATSAVRKMASAEKQASSETARIAEQANTAAEGLRQAESQAQRLLATVRKVGSTRALPAGLTGAQLALPAGLTGAQLALPAGGVGGGDAIPGASGAISGIPGPIAGSSGSTSRPGAMAGYARQGMAGAVGASMRALPSGSLAAPLPFSEQFVRQAEVLNRTLEQVERRYDETARRAVELGQKSGMAMVAASAGVAALLGYAVQVAGQFEQLRAKLETVQKSAIKAGETFDFARELAAKTPFDVQGVVAAAVQLEVYGTRAQKVLPLVADLAAGMGKRIEDTSLVVGKAMSGSLEGWESLRNEYGVSNAKLAQYGATLTATGGIAASTAGDLEKAKTALQRIIQTEFGGAVERQSRTLQGALSNAGDSVQNLAATYGEALVPLVTGAASAFSGLVDAATSAPPPLRAVAVGVAAAGAGLLVMAGGTTIAVAGLVAMNSQLLAAGPNIAAAGVAAKVTGGLLTGMAGAAGLARKAFIALGTTPLGVALTALAAGFVSVKGSIDHYNDQQVALGNAFSEQSRQLARATQEWRALQSAIDDAASSRGVAGITLQGGQSGVVEGLQNLRETVSPDVLLKALHKAYGSLENVKERAVEAREEIGSLLQQRRSLEDLQNMGAGLKVDIRESGELQKLFPGVDFLTVDQVNDAVQNLDARLQKLRGSFGGLTFAKDLFEELETPLNRAVSATQRLDNYLKFAGKAGDIRTMTEAMEETRETLSRLQRQAQASGLPAYDAGALRQRLLSPETTEPEAEAITRLLTLMGEVESQAERINQANEKAHSERIRLMDQEFSRSQAGRDQDLNATIAHLERKLQAVRGNAEQETQVINQLAQARKQQRQEEIQAQKTGLQDAIRAATEETQRLASTGEGTAAQVAEGYRGVLVILDDWARAHKVLLDQVPELRQEYDRLRQGTEDQVASSERTARAEKLSTLREHAREMQAGARGQQEQLQATRDSLDLYERVLRSSQDLRNDAQSRKALQSEINDLRRREVDLVEQLAERERQSKQQTAGLSQQLLDAEIATLEARLRAGEDVESELQAKRAERYRAALEMIQAETDAEVQAAEGNQVLIEEALKRGLTRRRLLQEQERQRLLSGLRQEVSAVKDAESQKDRARKRFRPEDRIGGENSPIMTGEEAFADVLPGMKGLQLGNTPSILGAKKAEDNTRQQAEDELKTLGEAAQQTGKSLSELPPVQTEFGAAATAGGVSLRELAAAASQAAASLSSIAGGGAGAGGGGEDLPPAPEGTTTDGKFSYAPGYGPKDAKPVADGGYPTTGYPGLERRMPTPVEMGAVSPRVVMQAPVRTNSMSRSDVRQTVVVNGAANTEPQAQVVAREAAKLVEQQQQRKRLMAGPWR